MGSDEALDFGVEPERLPDEPPELLRPAPVARPAPRAFAQTATQAAGRTLPHSFEAEECFLASCMIDGDDVVPRAKDAGITAGPMGSLYNPPHGVILAAIYDLHARGQSTDLALVYEELKTRGDLDKAGGIAELSRISSRVPTTAQASYFIGKVREQAILREVIRSATGIVEDCYGFSGGIEEFAAEAEAKLRRATGRAQGESAAAVRSFGEFDYPQADDPNVLLGADDYLGRGGGMLFVSHAGAGKSSFVTDAVASWALGRPWMGIRCNGALRTLIVQAEDSDRYMGKLRRSFLVANKLGPEEDAQLSRNVMVARVKGRCGERFFSELRKLVAKYKPDLVVINPIYLYAEGDIARSEYAQPFLVGLDDLNREEKFAYILVHHTGKPEKRDAKGKRAELEDWETIYMGFGSSYLANWPRCSALLEPRAGTKSRYWLKLGKGGMNAGVTREVEQGAGKRIEPVTRIAIRHSNDRMTIAGRERPVICWVQDDETATEAEVQAGGGEKRPRGRPKLAPSDMQRQAFRAALAKHFKGEANAASLNQIHRRMAENKITEAIANQLLDEAKAAGLLAMTDNARFYAPGQQ